MTQDDIRAGDIAQPQADVPIAPPTTTLDAAGRHVLAVDIPCIQCGYNLRGLDRETVCPECAREVERSLHGRWLRFAEPSWLNALRFGTVLMLWNLLITLATAVVAGILAFSGSPIAWINFLDVPSAAIAIWAIMLVTRQEPALALTEDAVTLRKVLRRAVVLVFGLHIVKLGVGFPFGLMGIQVATTVLQAVGVVVQCCLLLYFKGLAARIPRPSLEKATTPAIWGIAASGTASLVLGAVMLLTGTTIGPTAPLGWIIGVAFVIGAANIVFFVWYVVLLFLYNGAWSRALDEALAIGSAPVATPVVVSAPDEGRTGI